MQPDVQTTKAFPASIEYSGDHCSSSALVGKREVGGQGDRRRSRPLEESQHAASDSIVDPAPEDRSVQGNLSPSATYMGDVYDGGVNWMIARPGVDVKSGMRTGLEPEDAEDVAEDLDGQSLYRRCIYAYSAGARSMIGSLEYRIAHEMVGVT